MSRTTMWAGCGIMVLGIGYWLWSSGSSNLLAYGMLLLCPLLHLFMHRGHGQHGESHAHTAKEGQPSDEKKPACH